jgi:hypothetical protein
MASGHIDNAIAVIGCDPIVESINADAMRKTILGLA